MERSEEGEGEDREGDGGLNVAPIVATVEEIQQRLIRPPLPFPFWSACDESRCRSSRFPRLPPLIPISIAFNVRQILELL